MLLNINIAFMSTFSRTLINKFLQYSVFSSVLLSFSADLRTLEEYLKPVSVFC